MAKRDPRSTKRGPRTGRGGIVARPVGSRDSLGPVYGHNKLPNPPSSTQRRLIKAAYKPAHSVPGLPYGGTPRKESIRAPGLENRLPNCSRSPISGVPKRRFSFTFGGALKPRSCFQRFASG